MEIRKPSNLWSEGLTFTKNFNQILTQIMAGHQVNQNQLKLKKMRQNDKYILSLCSLLEQSSKQSLLSMNNYQLNKRNWIALQIKKNVQKMHIQQCWWLLRETYLNVADQKIATLLRDAFLLYQHQQNTQSNPFYVLFIADLQSVGETGILRYLRLTYEYIGKNFKKYQPRQIAHFGEQIVQKHFQLLSWGLIDQLKQFAITNLLLIYGILRNQQYWKKQQYLSLLQNLVESQSTSLFKTLSKQLRQQIINSTNQPNLNQNNSNNQTFYHNNSNNHAFYHNNSNNQTFYHNNSNNHAFYHDNSNNQTFYHDNQQSKKCLLQSLEYCLEKTNETNLLAQYQFYTDSLLLIAENWIRGIRNSNNSQNFQSKLKVAAQIIKIYSQFINKQMQNERKLNIFDNQQEDQDENNELKIKKYCFLQSVLQIFNKQQLRNIIKYNGTNFQMQIIQFALIFDFLAPDSIQQYEFLLDSLKNALQQQYDAYLFAKQKEQFIWGLLRYCIKYYKRFDKKLILKTSYIVDYLIFKCECLAEQGFYILEALAQQLLNIEGYELLDYLECTLQHVNDNQWIEMWNSYFHIIKIITSMNPQHIFNKSAQNTTLSSRLQINLQFQENSNYFELDGTQYVMPQINILGQKQEQYSFIQNQIIKMITNMIIKLRKKFNYETTHKLNSLFAYLIQSRQYRICHAIKIQDAQFICTLNFNYQIYTPQFLDLYYYYSLFLQNRFSIIYGLNTYNFWKQCQSQKLSFFVSYYLKIIQPNNQHFSVIQSEKKLNELRKNIWHRFVEQKDQDEREKIVQVFSKNGKYLEQLYIQYMRSNQWGKNQSGNSDQNSEQLYDQNWSNQYGSGYSGIEKMEVE